jgi:hypothetical protein
MPIEVTITGYSPRRFGDADMSETSRKPQRRRAGSAPLPIPAQRAVTRDPNPGALTTAFIESERRRAMIAEAAYYLAERRGFCPGSEVDDWLAAESAIDQDLAHGAPASPGETD